MHSILVREYESTYSLLMIATSTDIAFRYLIRLSLCHNQRHVESRNQPQINVTSQSEAFASDLKDLVEDNKMGLVTWRTLSFKKLLLSSKPSTCPGNKPLRTRSKVDRLGNPQLNRLRVGEVPIEPAASCQIDS
jgi:hypothetical protein